MLALEITRFDVAELSEGQTLRCCCWAVQRLVLFGIGLAAGSLNAAENPENGSDCTALAPGDVTTKSANGLRLGGQAVDGNFEMKSQTVLAAFHDYIVLLLYFFLSVFFFMYLPQSVSRKQGRSVGKSDFSNKIKLPETS